MRMTIIGLGLIGGSLGLALKKNKLEGLEVIGHDKDHEVAGKAQRRGAVDRAEWNLPRAVEKANIVVVATPVQAIGEVLGQIAPHLEPGVVVTDTGSTKAQVMAWARERLPDTVSFVGGHPMAGKETPGIEAADAGLFTGCTYCLVPDQRATEEAVKAIVAMVQIIGAKHLFVDAQEHDGLVAAVSHLPLVVSAALVTATASSPAWRELARLAASGYRDVTRLASGDPVMGRDICLTNRDNLLRWLDTYVEQLRHYRQWLQEANGEALGKALTQARDARDRWLANTDVETPPVEVGSFQETLSAMFMGDRLARRLSRIEKASKDRK